MQFGITPSMGGEGLPPPENREVNEHGFVSRTLHALGSFLGIVENDADGTVITPDSGGSAVGHVQAIYDPPHISEERKKTL